MKLYYMPGACSLASHIVLEWLGKPYETHKLSRDELKGPEFLKINPLGAVPALADGDWTLTQNVAILEYLAEQAPQSKLMGDGSARSRAEVRRWLGFINSDLHKTFSLVFAPMRFLSEEGAQKELAANASKLLSAVRAARCPAGRQVLPGGRRPQRGRRLSLRGADLGAWQAGRPDRPGQSGRVLQAHAGKQRREGRSQGRRPGAAPRGRPASEPAPGRRMMAAPPGRRDMRRPRSANSQIRAAMPLSGRLAEHRGMPEAGPLSEPGAAPLRSLKVNSFSQGCYLGVLAAWAPWPAPLSRLAALTPADVDQQHIPTLLRNDPRIPDRSSAYMAGGENPLPYMVEGVRFLERAGAQLIAIPCNTAHLWYDQIAAATRLPVLHIIEAVIDDLRRLGLPKGIGLMGTAATLKLGLYQRHLEAQGYECLVPDETRSSAIAWARSAP